MLRKVFWGGLIFILHWLGCTSADKPPEAESNPAQNLIDKAIQVHGGTAYEQAAFAFDFRDKQYSWQRQGGQFEYQRSFTDSTGQIRDVLNNEGFYRLRNGEKTATTHEQDSMYSNSVNSVLYFIQLPYGLNDPAVNKKYLGSESVAGEPYEKVQITFDQEGGGKDYEDVFVYWIHQQKYTMDYLAYSYETDGGGLRFRKAYHPRKIGGILFQDYVNYKAEPQPGLTPDQLARLFEQGQLDSLSSIVSENIRTLQP